MFELREMQPADGPAIKLLMENDPETPGLSLTTHFLVDPYQAWTALKPDLAGVVAEVPGVEGLVGAATIAFEPVQYAGQMLPGAFLENLKVRHDYRGKGLGTQLAQWRLNKARERFGEQIVIMTGTTSDNHASLATMKKWANQFLGPLTMTPIPPRKQPPKPLAGITVRPAQVEDFEEISTRSNQFYADCSLYAPLSPEMLDTLLRQAHDVYHYRVVVDAAGNILAGIILSERSRLMVDEVHNVPLPLRLANMILHMLPQDHILRQMECAQLWFDQPGYARYLWESIRWEFRDRATSFQLSVDPRGPLHQIIPLKPWNQPRIKIVIAVRGPVLLDENKWIANSIRG